MKFLKFKKLKNIYTKKIINNIKSISKKKLLLISTLTIMFIISTFLYLYVIVPNSTNVQAPVIVAYNDCDSLPSLRIEILDKKKLRIYADFKIKDNWKVLMVQAPKNATNAEIEVGDKKLSSKEKNLTKILRDDNYFKFTSNQFKKYFNSNDSYVTISYEMEEGLYKKSYNKYFLSVLFVPTNQKRQNYEVPIQVSAPQTFLMTSSIPSAYRIFLLDNGITYSFTTISDRSGILLIFDDLSAEASKEIILLIATTILGFIFGFILEKTLKV